MNKKLEDVLLWQDKPAIQYSVPIICFVLMVVITISAMLHNTFNMKSHLERYAETHADGVSNQLAKSIEAGLERRLDYIENLAQSFSDMPESHFTNELFWHKSEHLGMSNIYILNEDGTTIPAGKYSETTMRAVNSDVDVCCKPQIVLDDSLGMIFSAPMSSADGSKRVLIGECRGEGVRKLLYETNGRSRGMCCIIDGSGKVMFSPEDKKPFEELKEVFLHTEEKDAKAVQKVLDDIKNQKSDIAVLYSLNGYPTMVGYDYLNFNDWMLITLIPHNIFTEGIGEYLANYIGISVLMAVVAGFIFIFIIWVYRKSMKRIKAVALTDAITGGLNNVAFRVKGHYSLQQGILDKGAVVFLKVKHFKNIYVLNGRDSGDRILKRFYEIIAEELIEDEIVAHAEGACFYILLKCDEEEEVLKRLDEILCKIEAEFAESFLIDRYSISQGACIIKESDDDFVKLQNRANTASSHQLSKGVCRFFDKNLGDEMEHDRYIEETFKRAIVNHEFKVYIQPKVSVDGKKTCGGEVLCRWEHPQYGFLSPARFIPLLERSGKICELDFYMFEETCKLLRQWLDYGHVVPLSVNLSRAHLISRNFDFLDYFKEIKEKYNIPDNLIELELTETLLLERNETKMTMEVIDRIRSLGFCCSMDDFGFGNSSLTLLKDLNVNVVKLDRQFFMGESEKSWIVVKQLIELAHQLGITVVAEGIEEMEQVDKLRNCNCDIVQGYVYAKPMSALHFEEWIDNK